MCPEGEFRGIPHCVGRCRVDMWTDKRAPFAERPRAGDCGCDHTLIPAPLVLVVGENLDPAARAGRAGCNASHGVGIHNTWGLDAAIGTILKPYALFGI